MSELDEFSKGLAEDLKIRPLSLNEDVMRQPGLYAFYAEKLRAAREELRRKKLQHEVSVATVDNEVRKGLAARGEKGTERLVELTVNSRAVIVESAKTIIELEGQVEKMEALVRAMGMKKDMLQTLARSLQTEFEQARFTQIRTEMK